TLMEKMMLVPGIVSPFGLLNNEDKDIKVYIDKEFENTSLGIHPNDNTASIWLETKELVNLLRDTGAEVEYIELKGEEAAE
ncbi:MAG: prolyl-tRNA synthetase associated domain-containing protein, partial [Firmicutes bacterium]|nr:prolyl-tRNA synthetase associated domain-containing protein [Bacillota bacterium]